MNTSVKNFRPFTKSADLQIEENLANTSIHRGMLKKLIPLVYPIRYLLLALIAVEILQVMSVFVRPWVVKYILDSGFQQIA
jgi:putative ABC transport system ATP-binding protein